MFISPYSYRASAILNRSISWRILSCNLSSLSWAFSAEISSCFMFSPTASNSSSTAFNFDPANSARSTALLSSSSWTPHLRVISSSFCSLSEAILVVSLKFLSASSISTSLFMDLFSKYLTFFKIPSASLEAIANLVTVSAKAVSAFFGFLLHQHDTSRQGTDIFLSGLVHFFLFFKSSQSLGQFVIGFIKIHLISLDFLAQIPDVAIILITSGIGFPGITFEFGDGGKETISLTLERLHLLPDSIHGVLNLVVFSELK